jgi:UDP-N-acetylmuramoyl-tripeptide--D-alanyl-D-alanine ligase
MAAVWGEITAGELRSVVKGKILGGRGNEIFTGLSTDSRTIQPGELFWALKGERYDGHDFASPAVARGALGILVEEEKTLGKIEFSKTVVIAVRDSLRALGDLAMWWRHQFDAPVAAVTGSAGKTTTKEMAGSILAQEADTLTTQGNFNNLIGLPLTVLGLAGRHRRVVLEMGMNRPGEIDRLTEIADPDYGVITNVAGAHLEGLGSIEAVARAKTELIRRMSDRGTAILNGDDDRLMSAASGIGKKVVTFGLRRGNDVRAEDVKTEGWGGSSFRLKHGGRARTVHLRVPGMQNISNALAAAALSLCMNVSPDLIARGLYAYRGLKGRFKIVPLKSGTTLVDDTYNSNPASLEAAVESIQSMFPKEKRIIVGLGDMLELGDASVAAHREAGERVADLGAEHFFVMGKYAREMIKGAVDKGFPSHRASVVHAPEEMADEIRAVMKRGDLVFLKGSRRMRLDRTAADLKKSGPEERIHEKDKQDPGCR